MIGSVFKPNARSYDAAGNRKPSAPRVSSVMMLAAAVLLAQTTTAPYSPGPPQLPGTWTPEQSPATTIVPPATAPVAPTNPGQATGTGTAAPPSPGLSFGAAPPPVVSPNR
jgi:hypothetical protein